MASVSLPSAPTVSSGARRAGWFASWIRSVRFDSLLIGGTATVTMLAAAGLAIESQLFRLILILDIWLLGYHHVIATYARISFEPGGFKRYRALLTWVPLAVIASVVGLAAGVGAWTLPTIYLYWQWWHYTRQSYGLAQLYRLKTAQRERTLWEMKAVIYGLPLTGILYRSYQGPQEFLGRELKVVPVPGVAVELAAVLTVLALSWWGFRQWQAWRRDDLALTYNLYLLSHLAIFGTGYLAFASIEHGWLVINIWHNAQYLLIVWLTNHNRYKDHSDPLHRLASQLSKRGSVAHYFAATLFASTVIYAVLGVAVTAASISALPIALIVYQSINFHHYIVDSIIWKVRRPQLAATLGVQARQ